MYLHVTLRVLQPFCIAFRMGGLTLDTFKKEWSKVYQCVVIPCGKSQASNTSL